MKLLKQGLIIFSISIFGDFLSKNLQLPLPGSIIGIVILFSLLYFKVIKINDVDRLGSWLKDHMALLFIPITVGLMEEFDMISPYLAQLTLTMILTTAITYIAVAKIIERVQKNVK